MRRRPTQPPLPLVIPALPSAVRAELRRQIADGWGRKAACASPQVDPDWWFTPAGDERHTVARGICDSCPVRRSCLAYALVMEESDGIWGGFDETERTWIRLAVSEGTSVAAVLDLATQTAAA